MQICIFDVAFLWKAVCAPILLRVSLVLITVTKSWDKIIRLCMCNGQTHHVKGTESKSGCKRANTCDFCLPSTVKWESKCYIREEIDKQNVSEWCHTSHRKSSQCSIHICLNDNCLAAFIHVSNCITLRTNLLRMVEIFELAYGTSLQSRRGSSMWNGKEVEQYLTNTSGTTYMT